MVGTTVFTEDKTEGRKRNIDKLRLKAAAEKVGQSIFKQETFGIGSCPWVPDVMQSHRIFAK